MEVEIDVSGNEDLIGKLRKLQRNVAANVLKKVLRKAGTKIKRSVKQEAPERTGLLKKSIKVFADRSISSKGGALIRVGADASIAPHAHLVEFGTEERYLKKPTIISLLNGSYFYTEKTGAMPANNFFERGYESSKDEAIRVFQEEIKKEINNL
jgi:HK97 gp10 family phage protein